MQGIQHFHMIRLIKLTKLANSVWILARVKKDTSVIPRSNVNRFRCLKSKVSPCPTAAWMTFTQPTARMLEMCQVEIYTLRVFQQHLGIILSDHWQLRTRLTWHPLDHSSNSMTQKQIGSRHSLWDRSFHHNDLLYYPVQNPCSLFRREGTCTIQFIGPIYWWRCYKQCPWWGPYKVDRNHVFNIMMWIQVEAVEYLKSDAKNNIMS